MYDLIVVGGGPAGLAATTYALSKGLQVVCICSNMGGRAGNRLQTAGLREDTADDLGSATEQFTDHLQHLCTKRSNIILSDLVTNISKGEDGFQVSTNAYGVLPAKSVVLVTGAEARSIGVPDEWRLIGHGLGYSITTHAQAVAGQAVAVVGATERALRGVAELVQTAKSVALVAPEPAQIASPLGRALCAHPAVEVFRGYRVQSIDADPRCTRSITIAHEHDIRRLAVQAIFADLGLVPNSQMVRRLLQLDQQGAVVVDEMQCTSVAGLFAAGDVTSNPSEQVLVAIGDGTRAAVSAYAFVLQQQLPSVGLQEKQASS
jgi:thioredoxin reductase